MLLMIRSVGLLVPPSTPVLIDMQVYLPSLEEYGNNSKKYRKNSKEAAPGLVASR